MSLNDTVIRNNYCIGCGVCSVLQDSPFTVVRNKHGMREAMLTDSDSIAANDAKFERVCPFGQKSLDESQLAKILFPDLPRQMRYLGRFVSTYCGNVSSAENRAKSSSGGIGKWVGAELLRTNEVDAVLQVVPTPNESNEPLFSYEFIEKPEEVIRGARSAYYPVCMDEILRQILDSPGKRFLISGVPCFIKAIRLLCREDERFAKSIRYTLGLVCGHMKSEAYAEFIGWQLGMEPGTLHEIDFRGKTPGVKASAKANTVRSGERVESAMSQDLFGTNYSFGLFKPKACEYCDDVMAETADVSVGDAWLPEFVKDSRGTSIVVVRNRVIDGLILNGIARGELELQTLAPKEVVASQTSGLRHRNEGLEFRLATIGKQEAWLPPKRTKPNIFSRFKGRGGLYSLRYEMSKASHEFYAEAKEKNDISHFIDKMKPLIRKHSRIRKNSLSARILKLLKLKK